MTHILQELSFYLSYPFVRYALIVGVLIALCSSLLGVTLVLKRFSFIGDGLSHVAFGAMAVATIFKLVNNTIFIMPAKYGDCLTISVQEKCFSRRKSLLSVITNHYLSHWTFIWKEDRKSP